MTYRVGVDIGGTFTDFCAFNEQSGEISTLKVFSRPDSPGSEIIEGIRGLERKYGISPGEISHFTHGTTVGINAIIQRKGIRLCLLTTESFSDVLEIARLKMPDPYDLYSRRPAPLVSRDCVFGIRERIRADGSVDFPLDLDSVQRAVEAAQSAGANGVLISFLHSYRNSAHETAAKKFIREIAPELPVFCSNEVWPIIREYERTITAALHAYVQPRVSYYISSLQKALREAGVTCEPMLTKSNGGVMTAENGKTACAQMLLSGTASGVIGATLVAKQCDMPLVMSVDIGGTSADVAIIVNGEAQYGVGEIVGDFPIYIPSVSVSSIGAGGGSIACVDQFGMLTVGPESAGSTPGPACFRRGGTEPTITDAFGVCGFLGLADMGYDTVSPDIDAAREAVGKVAAQLSRSVEEAAAAIINVAVSGMYVEISKLLSKEGVDPRDMALMAFGGAGPMMTCFLARELNAQHVIIPRTPGVLAALGGLIADVRNDFIATTYSDVDDDTCAVLAPIAQDLKSCALAWLRDEQQFRDGEVVLAYSADMRYRGQSFEIEVKLDESMLREGADSNLLVRAFNDRHRQLYEFSDENARVQIVSLRLVVIGVKPKPFFPKGVISEREALPVSQATVFLDGQYREIPLFKRVELLPGETFSSPAVVVQEDTTVCIPEGFDAKVDAFANIILTRTAG
ncbi:hydantoinase/oxoprolinase family protein [Paraburkholderia sp.]|uniref:hydantoinase/oxoprolinase family protein n=1 Tax=Paraburkholderia sp. TaxID=1926495 RepID=UPI0039E58E76